MSWGSLEAKKKKKPTMYSGCTQTWKYGKWILSMNINVLASIIHYPAGGLAD